MALPESYIEEDILIDSIEVMVNASQSKIRDLGCLRCNRSSKQR